VTTCAKEPHAIVNRGAEECLERSVDYPNNDLGPATKPTTLEDCCARMLKSSGSYFQTTRFGECFMKSALPPGNRVAAGTGYVAGRRAPP
jgi:hypothetical protein